MKATKQTKESMKKLLLHIENHGLNYSKEKLQRGLVESIYQIMECVKEDESMSEAYNYIIHSLFISEEDMKGGE